MRYLDAVLLTYMNSDLIIHSCYSGNVPARRAKEPGAKAVFVVDVSALESRSPYFYGAALSGWIVLAVKIILNNKVKSLGIPPSANISN